MNGICYPKPLSLEDRLLIETVTTRYGGVEAPFMAFDRGDFIELRCPERITMTPARFAQLKRLQEYLANANQITDDAPSTLRISENGGRNGISN